MEKKRILKLYQVLRSLNITMDEAVEFLKSHDFPAPGSRRATISDETFELLKFHFNEKNKDALQSIYQIISNSVSENYFDLLINPGNSSQEDLNYLYESISNLNIVLGGDGLTFSVIPKNSLK